MSINIASVGDTVSRSVLLACDTWTRCHDVSMPAGATWVSLERGSWRETSEDGRTERRVCLGQAGSCECVCVCFPVEETPWFHKHPSRDQLQLENNGFF